MKTKAAIVAAAGLVLMALPVAAKPDAAREVTVQYQGPNTITGEDTYVSNTGPMAKPKPGERFLEVTVTDVSGRPVLAEVHQGNRELGPAICGATDKPVKLQGRGAVHVHLYAGAGCGEPSVPTQGTITFTFRR